MPTVKELKKELKEMGLKTSGTKNELEDRLKEVQKIPKNVKHPKIYLEAKQKVKSQVNVWPSAYASGQLVKTYKQMGGEYTGKKDPNKGIDRWFEEKWVNVCKPKKGGGYARCGRKQSDLKKYPYCRPSVRINKSTPKTVQEIRREKGDDYLSSLCKKKQSRGLPKNKKPTRIQRN